MKFSVLYLFPLDPVKEYCDQAWQRLHRQSPSFCGVIIFRLLRSLLSKRFDFPYGIAHRGTAWIQLNNVCRQHL